MGVSVQRNEMFVHNIYTALLMQTGIVGTALYLIWQLSFIGPLLKGLKMSKLKKESLIGLLFMFSLVVLAFPNAGLTQSGAYLMMFFVAALVRDIQKELKIDIKDGKSKRYENRCINIPSRD